MDTQIRKAYTDGLAGKLSTHILTFTIGGKTYSTPCNFSDAGLDTGCIEINEIMESEISANSVEKKCFTPVLLKENLPKEVTQTDILQVLSTKLKFILAEIKDNENEYELRVMLHDVARITPTKTPFSLWRLLRGEPTLYEKYGYISPSVDSFRRDVIYAPITWKEIKDILFEMPDGEKMDFVSILLKMGAPEFHDDEPIYEYMRKINYEDSDKYKERLRINKDTTIKETLPGFIFRAIENVKGKDKMPWFTFSVGKDSDIWKAWDNKMVFVSFEPKGVSGGRRRSGRRRRTYNLRKKLKHRRTRKSACVYKH